MSLVPYTRLIIMGNELLIGSNMSFPDPLFRHLSFNCILDLHASDKRASYSLIIGYLKPAYLPHYGFSDRPPLLAGKVHYSGADARDILFRPYFLTQAACRWRPITCICYSLQTTTPYTRLHPFAFEAHALTFVPFFRSGAWTS